MKSRFGKQKPTLRAIQQQMNMYAPPGGMVNPPEWMNKKAPEPRTRPNLAEEKKFMAGLFKLCADYYRTGLKRIWLRKNSNGVARSIDGQRYIKYGLGVGVSDGVGYVCRIIQPDDVGKTWAVFVAVEGKLREGGVITNAQQEFVDQVNRDGGVAFVAYDSDSYDSIVSRLV